MKLSYEWLKEYVNIKASAEDLAKGLTMSGSEVESIDEVEGDKIMGLEITTNRPDCLNIIGLAREASAVFDKDLKLPDMSLTKKAEDSGPEIECVIENEDLCPKYTARVITGVKVKPAGKKIKKRIVSMGIREVNNIVDVTNFCLMETGQPLHAFDLDKIKGGKIIIREAKKGEEIVTIDGEERQLVPGMLVIADMEGPIAIAGVMGGQGTEVSESTKNILLESAYFDPISIRRTARTLGLSSDSSYRFERGVDKSLVAASSDRAAGMIVSEAGGKICRFYDTGSQKIECISIRFDVDRTERTLGVKLDRKKVKTILKRLGIEITKEAGDSLTLKIPTFREDLKEEIDIVEEIARIYGYENIEPTVTKPIFQCIRKEEPRQVLEKLVQVLVSLGLNEIMTYSLISDKACERFSGITQDHVSLKNPLSEEQKVLTPQLLDGMLKSVSWNINRRNSDLAFFEIGKIYSRLPKGDGYSEIPALCIGLTGDAVNNWKDGGRKVDYFDLKGILETSLERLRLVPSFAGKDLEGFVNGIEITVGHDKKSTGFLGEVNKKMLDAYDIEQPVYICQIKLDSVLKEADLNNIYHSYGRFPSSTRDLSILCDQSIQADEIHKIIAETGEEIIRSIKLTDLYTGKQIEAGKRSLTYSIEYGLDTRTLTDEEVTAVNSKVKDNLTKKLNVSFR